MKGLLEPTIGTDFELAIYDNANKKYISGVNKIGGTKEVPESIGNDCSKQEDNVAIEFCIPPVTDLESFKNYIGYCINIGNNIAKSIDPNYSLKAVSSAVYDQDQLNTEKAQMFGCEPSMDAYTQELNHPAAREGLDLRTFGFHIHLGWTNNHEVDHEFTVIKLFDLFLGVPSLLLENDTRRRELYGPPGDFRFKPYGVEYRTLGSELLKNQENIEIIWNNIQRVIQIINNDEVSKYEPYFMTAREIIKTNNRAEAEKLCSSLKLLNKKELKYV